MGASLLRHSSKSLPTGTVLEAISQSVERVTLLDIQAIAVGASSRSMHFAAHVFADVSRIQASCGSAIRNDDQYGSIACLSAMPPCPYAASSHSISCTASLALEALSTASLTRSIPIRAEGASYGSSIVYIFSFPIATRLEFIPCSAPHSHVGLDRRHGSDPASSMFIYCTGREWRPKSGGRSCSAKRVCASPTGRSEFFAKKVPCLVIKQSVSHISLATPPAYVPIPSVLGDQTKRVTHIYIL